MTTKSNIRGRTWLVGWNRVTLSCLVAGSTVLCGNVSFAADWVSLVPRDPFAWVDLDSKRIDADGFIRVQISLSGNPSRPQNLGTPMRLVQKAVDCKAENAVYDVDPNGRVRREHPVRSAIEQVLTLTQDTDLQRALFTRICLNRRMND